MVLQITWQDKCTAIATTVHNLGAEFRPAIRKGWLVYIKKAFPEGAAYNGTALGQARQGTLIAVMDDVELNAAAAGEH